MQLTFGDGEGLGQRKRTRREVFLAEMDQVVPWKALLALIEPHYPKMGRPGRQPYPLAPMLRDHFLQQWYALSDPSMEEALYEIPRLRRFAQLGGRDASRTRRPSSTSTGCWRRWTSPGSSQARQCATCGPGGTSAGNVTSQRAGKGRAPVPGRQVSVLLHQGALSGLAKIAAQVLTLLALSWRLRVARRRLLQPTG